MRRTNFRMSSPISRTPDRYFQLENRARSQSKAVPWVQAEGVQAAFGEAGAS